MANRCKNKYCLQCIISGELYQQLDRAQITINSSILTLFSKFNPKYQKTPPKLYPILTQPQSTKKSLPNPQNILSSNTPQHPMNRHPDNQYLKFDNNTMTQIKQVAISLRQQQTVEQILAEVGCSNTPLDPELQALITQGQIELQHYYETQAEQHHLRNRMAVNFDELRESFDLDAPQEVCAGTPAPTERELEVFQRQSTERYRLNEREAVELDHQLPKLNYTGLLGQQQRIFQMGACAAAKWLSFQRVAADSVCVGVSLRVGDVRWVLVGSGRQLAVFVGESEQPQVLAHALPISAAAVSACSRYLAVATQSQLSVYQIRKGRNIVLLKHFADLNVGIISHVIFLSRQRPTLVFSDGIRLVLVTIDLGLLLTKVKVQELHHELPKIDSCAALTTPVGCLVAVGGAGQVELIKVEPEVERVQAVRVESGGKVSVAWRAGEKAGLLVGCGERVSLYRLLLEEDTYYLQEHLLFLNHYCIEEIFLISPFHLLVQSSDNFAVVGLPLIASALDAPDLAQSETALVFSLNRPPHHRVLFASQEGILLAWGGVLREGRLRGLQEELEELLVGRSAYRQAFALLVLVSRGMNYSYRFSYTPEDLRRAVYGALEVAISSFLPQLEPRIALFRVGWAVQFCLETSQQDLLWQLLHPRLKEKGLSAQLFEVLQTFALRGQLVEVPEEALLEAVEYYAEKGRQAVVEGLVLANRQTCEASRLLGLLNQKEMNYLQFSLFSRGVLSEECDFYTPFLRAFSAFSRANAENIRESALLCYFILTKTFLFEHVPSAEMASPTKHHVATHFFPQSLARPFLRKLADYDLRLLLQALLVPFLHPQFRSLILQEQSTILCTLQQLAETDCKDLMDVLLQHIENSIGHQRSSYLFTEFCSTLLFLMGSTARFERVVELLAGLFQRRFYDYELRSWVGERPSTAHLKQYMLALITDDLRSRQDRLCIKKLLTYQDREVGYLLHRIDRNYAAALDLFLASRGPQGLIAFACEIAREVDSLPEANFLRERKRVEVRAFLVRNIGLLFRTDSSAALELFYLIGETTPRIHDTLFLGHFTQREKLDFLTAVLTRWAHEDFALKETYLLEHLEEVCQLPEEELRTYLERFYYPLDPAIRVADQRGNYLAKALLQAKAGQLELAFTSYEKLIRTTLLARQEQSSTRTRVNRYISECILLCKLFSSQTLEENLWVRLMRFIGSFVASEHQYKVYLKVELERATQDIVAEMQRCLPTPLLVSFFTSPHLPLPPHKLLPIHAHLFRALRFDRFNAQRALLVFAADLPVIRRDLTIHNKAGLCLPAACDFCRAPLSEEPRCSGYWCGHAFHKICHDDPALCLSCSYESDASLFHRAIFRRSDKKEKDKKEKKEKKKGEIMADIYVETQQQARTETRKKRLKLYDFELQAAEQRAELLASPHLSPHSVTL